MRIRNNKLKLLSIVLILFACSFFVNIKDTFGIYKSSLSTTFNLTVLEPTATSTVNFYMNDGTNTIYETRTVNVGEYVDALNTPTRTNYNFMGWYDQNDRRIYANEVIAGDVDFYAHWVKIVCKKTTAGNLNTETCAGSNGCRTGGTGYSSNNNLITYGTIFGNGSPKSGDAYDCDIDADDIYDETQNGKHIERFYFVREKENQSGGNTAVLIYYTSYDSAHGRVDTQSIGSDYSTIGSDHYSVAEGWLPTSSTTGWSNPGLIDFDGNNGKITRFLSVPDLEAVCGPIDRNSSTSISANADYFTSCFNNPNADGPNWYMFENSRFQSSTLGRAGIWLQPIDGKYYRIHTSTLNVGNYASGTAGDNMARPVIEIPMSALDGFVNEDRFEITFETHGGTEVTEVRRRYDGEEVGTLPTTTRDHYTLDGWYSTYINDLYSNPVTASTVVHSDLTLHAKWTAIPTCTVTLELDGGTGVDTQAIVDIGSFYEPGTPSKTDHSFGGWYTDSNLTVPYDSTVAISTSTLTLYAKWTSVNYAVRVEGKGDYETLAEAINNVPTGKVKTRVTLLKDLTLTSTATIPSTKYVEFDAGNYTLSGSSAALFTNSGQLDIIGGTLQATGYPVVSMGTNSTLNVIDGTLTGNGEQIINCNSGTTVNISGGTLTNTTTESRNVIEINTGTVNITGGVLTNYGTGAVLNNRTGGLLNISGGRVIGTNQTKGQAVYMENANSRTNISGDAYLENVSGKSGNLRAAVDVTNGTLTVTGGTIVSTAYIAVETRGNASATATIGNSDDPIDITNPVIRGKTYGLKRTLGTITVYDGIFESLNNTSAVNGTIGTPTGINFVNDTIDVSGVTYHSTYLYEPTVTIKFDANSGTVEGEDYVEVTVDNGDTIGADMPADPIRANYYFVGWYDANNNAFTSSIQVTMSKTVYAKWVQDFTNGTVPSSLSVEMTKTENIVITGSDLEDVTYTSSDTNVATVDSDGTVHGVNIGSTTITITGTKSGSTSLVTVTVTPLMRTVRFFDSDGETLLDTETVANNTSLGANMYNATKTNYALDKWTIKDTVTVFTSATTVTGDIDVIASWKETVNYATLTTSTNPFAIVVGNTGQITLSATTQGDTVEPCTYTSADSNYATVDSSGQVTGVLVGTTNITITGTLSGETRTVEVIVTNPTNTVNFYNGETLYDSKTVDVGGSVGANMPNDPTKQNHIFAGWYINDDVLTPFTSSANVIHDTNVYAKWKETLTIATLPVSPMRIIIGTNQEVVVSPISEDFVEDYTISSSNTNYVEVSGKQIYGMALGTITLTITGAESNVSRTITVEVVNTYDVTFDPDDGTTPTTIQVEIGTSIDDSGEDLPNNPTKSGYTFDDWYVYDEANDVVTTTRLNTSEVVTSTLVYKPRWAGANDVAAIGTTYYTTPAAAIAAVTDSTPTEIRLLKDYAIASGRTTVDSGKNITIDAKGHELSCSSGTTGDLLYVDGGTLRVKNGTFTCNKSTLATLETSSRTNPKSYLYIEDGTTVTNTNNRGAVYNSGTLYILGGTIESSTSVRSTITNGAAGARVEMSGGTVSQTATSYTADNKNNGKGAIKVDAGTVIITGGTVTSNSTNSAAIDKTNGGTLIIGTDDNDNSYDATNPIIQGEQYGIEATSNFSIYDGIIKGKTAAVSDESKINGTETGTTKQNGTEGLYYTLYYAEPAPVEKYRINFYTNGGSGVASYIEYNVNEQITPSDLPTPTRGIYTFDGWYTDVGLNTAFTTITPTQAGSMDCYASWSYASSSTPVSHIVTSDAMTYYFNNVSSWASADAQISVNQDSDLSNDDHTTFTSNLYSNFTNYSCSECEYPNGRANMNSCSSPSTGTYCDKPKGYDTGVDDELDVYLYVNGAKSGSKLNGSSAGNYITVTNGVIYNMIPGNDYYWELSSDSNVYGVVSATKNGTHYRRTLNTSIRNLRDLGGMSVSYTENNVTTTGTVKYGRIYRGAQIASGATGVNELKKLGITREIDLRGNGDGNSNQSKFEAAYYDVALSDTNFRDCRHTEGLNEYCFNNPNSYSTDGYYDIKIVNYQVNPVANTYFSSAYSDNFDDLKAAMKAIMRQIVNHENIFFHCTIGTDRTGTIAYFLEGLLGVSDEDRLRDYEMTYYFGLTNRSRFHNTLSTSSINPRFYAMYKSYPTVADIEDFYFTHPESDDASLLAAFRQEMIIVNQ